MLNFKLFKLTKLAGNSHKITLVVVSDYFQFFSIVFHENDYLLHCHVFNLCSNTRTVVSVIQKGLHNKLLNINVILLQYYIYVQKLVWNTFNRPSHNRRTNKTSWLDVESLLNLFCLSCDCVNADWNALPTSFCT